MSHTNAQATLNAQYIKDLSFENPNAPFSLLGNNTPPKISLNLNLHAGKVQDNIFEVVLHINAHATSEEKTVFLIELKYAGVFTLDNVPEEEREVRLLIDCPKIIFPFARRIIADSVRDGGFQPLMIDPIDFESLYKLHKDNSNVTMS